MTTTKTRYELDANDSQFLAMLIDKYIQDNKEQLGVTAQQHLQKMWLMFELPVNNIICQ